MERHYKVQEAAELLQVDDELVLAKIATGEITAINVASDPNGKRPRWRIAESELGRFLLRRRNPAAVQQEPQRKPRRNSQPKQYV